MKIENNNNFRVYILQDAFFDVNSIYYQQGVEIKTFEFCSYWVVLKDTTEKYNPYKIVFFKIQEYFDEWILENPNYEIMFKPEILEHK